MMKRYIACIPIILLLFLWNKPSYAQQNRPEMDGIALNKGGIGLHASLASFTKLPAIRTIAIVPAEKSLFMKEGNLYLKKGLIGPDTIKVSNAKAANLIPLGYDIYRSPDELTGAVSIVRANDLAEKSSIINPHNLLKGKIPGLYVPLTHPTSKPASPGFYLRGRETWNSNTPIILIDGFWNTSFRRVAPDAIESITVLKDAAALALYGERGGNGVILIKTKRGSAHPLEVHASHNHAITQPLDMPDFVGAATYASALNEARANDGLSPRYSDKEIGYFKSGKYPYLYPNVNWPKLTLRGHGLRSISNVTLSGGNETAQYFVLLNYDHTSSIYRPAARNVGHKTQLHYGRVNFRTNLDINLTNTTLLKLNFGTFLYDIHNPSGQYSVATIFDELYSIPSAAFPVRLPDGTWGGTQIHSVNPRARLVANGYGNPTARQLALGARIQQNFDSITKGLSFEGMFKYVNFGSFHQYFSQDHTYGSLSPVKDGAGNVVDANEAVYGQNTDLSFHNSFGNVIRLSDIAAKIGYSRTFGNNKIDAMILGHQSQRVANGVNQVWRWQNLAGDFHYGYDNTYFFDGAVSFEGRNNMPANAQFNPYPAVSAAWLISNESFLKNASFLNRLKLRVSWGIVGIDRSVPLSRPYIGIYDYGVTHRATQLTDDFKHEASFGLQQVRVPNHLFGPEKSHKYNVGISAGLFSHLDVKADFFYDRRTNIRRTTSGLYSVILGIKPPIIANGIVKNKGMEGSLKLHGGKGNFSWHVGGQFSYARNEIVQYNEQPRPYPYLRRTGQQIGQYFGWRAIGFFKSEQDIKDSPTQLLGKVKPGDLKYQDMNNDKVIDQYDQIPMGYSSAYPQMLYAASLGFEYKGFGLSVMFDGTGHQTAYLTAESVYQPLLNNKTISKWYYNRRWTPDKKSTATLSNTLPRLTTESNSNNFRHNNIWLVNKAYIALRHVKLSYTLPASAVNSLHMNSIKITAQGRNLYNWNHIPVGSPGRYGVSFPMLRYYTLGLAISF